MAGRDRWPPGFVGVYRTPRLARFVSHDCTTRPRVRGGLSDPGLLGRFAAVAQRGLGSALPACFRGGLSELAWLGRPGPAGPGSMGRATGAGPPRPLCVGARAVWGLGGFSTRQAAPRDGGPCAREADGEVSGGAPALPSVLRGLGPRTLDATSGPAATRGARPGVGAQRGRRGPVGRPCRKRKDQSP